jgi:hypothetical protein
MPELTTGSVHQLLEVLEHARRNYGRGVPLPTAYHDSVRDVSNRHRVTYQTIGDFRRRLAFRDIDEFMDLLNRWLRGDPEPIRRRIKQHSTPSAYGLIERFFREGGLPVPSPAPARRHDADRTGRRSSSEPEMLEALPAGAGELRLRIPPATQQRLHLAVLAKIGPTIEETAIALLEKGFEAEKQRIRQFLDAAVGAT